MKKITLFLASLLFSIGALAQTTITSLSEIDNNSTFTIKSVNRGYLYFDHSADAIFSSSYNTLTDATPSGAQNEQFAFLRGTDTPEGQYYLYSIAAQRFINTIDGNVGLALSKEASTLVALEKVDSYFVIKITNGSHQDEVINITNWQASNGCKVIGTKPDEGNKMTLVKRQTDFDPTYALRSMTDPLENNATFNWNSSTPWESTEANELTSTVLNDNALANGIEYVEQNIKIGGARTATVKFQYTSGNCALNIRGVEVVDAWGYIVAGDYHVGKAGGSHENNTYTVSVAEAGTYTVRIYATFDGDNRASATNGNVTVSYEYPAANQFSHDVTFSAEYATLYLGYKAAIPEGVEAYVVTSAANGWAHLEEVEGVLPANTGVILKNVGGVKTYTFAYSDKTPAEVETNFLDGSIANRYVCEEAYVLANGESGVGLYAAELNKLNETAFLNNANKAYLPIATQGVNALRFNFDGETTAIETVETENANAPIYDLSGRRVLSTVKGGIYIQNGKKFIVK